MADVKKHKLSIHHSNLYEPDPMGITNIAKSGDLRFLAITKEHIQPDRKIPALTIIEVYQIYPYLNPKLVLRFVEYECLTGIAWITDKLLLTTSQEQTISVYSLKNGTKTNTTMTDYGPIWCMKYDEQTKLLLTGTEYGYVACYRIDDKGKTIEPVGKMVKIKDKILSLDLTCRPKEKTVIKQPKAILPGKRKRSDSSDDSDDNEDGDVEPDEYLATTDITIYGASQGNVVVWDFHRKAIIDTIRVGDESCAVCSVVALHNGDVAAGDSLGTLSIFDHKSLTCRMTTNVSESAILSIAEDRKGSCITVSGREPTILLMKRDKLEPNNFILVEKFEIHTHDVTAMTFLGRNDFLTGSLDGLLVRFHIKRKTGRLLEKYITNTGYRNNVRFSDGEMLIQNRRSLTVWRLPKAGVSSPKKNAPAQENQQPVKSLVIKTREYIHTSTFSDRWVSYSTRKGLHIFERTGDRLDTFRTDKKLINCNALELCSNRYLAAASQRSLYIIDLKKDKDQGEESKEKLAKCVVLEQSLKSNVKQMIYFEHMDQLIVACSCPDNYLYLCNLMGMNASPNKSVIKLDYKKISMPEVNISFVTYNAAIKRDSNIYIYTDNDQIIKFDVSIEDAKLPDVSSIERIIGLPEDANIIGMMIISREQCIIYDKSRMFKVDMVGNRVINQRSDYGLIVGMDNFLFRKPEQMALVELKPEDYLKLLPPSKQRRKFGDV